MKLLAVLCLSFASLPAFAQDKVINFSEGDTKMNAAMADARDSFDAFWDRVANDDGVSGEGASIKVAAPYGDDGREHIWMGPCKKLDEPQFVCFIGNEPVHLEEKIGDPFTFTRDQISDWMIMTDEGKIEGAYTLRVMLPQLPESQAEEFRAMLLPLPE